MPPLDEEGLVFKGQLPDTAEFGGVEALGEIETDGREPVFRDGVALADVDVWRLLAFAGEEVKSEAIDDEDGRHAVSFMGVVGEVDCTSVLLGGPC